MTEEGGRIAPLSPMQQWRQTRYVSASAEWTQKGYFMDTVEVTLPWSRLTEAYEQMAATVHAITPAGRMPIPMGPANT